jgi:hypothetical protein
VTLPKLLEDIVPTVSYAELLEALESLEAQFSRHYAAEFPMQNCWKHWSQQQY